MCLIPSRIGSLLCFATESFAVVPPQFGSQLCWFAVLVQLCTQDGHSRDTVGGGKLLKVPIMFGGCPPFLLQLPVCRHCGTLWNLLDDLTVCCIWWVPARFCVLYPFWITFCRMPLVSVQWRWGGGHELCPKCLGLSHLREAPADPCIDCNLLLLSVKEEILHQEQGLLLGDDNLPAEPSQVATVSYWQHGKRKDKSGMTRSSPKRKKAKPRAPSHQQMEAPQVEVEQLKALVWSQTSTLVLVSHAWDLIAGWCYVLKGFEFTVPGCLLCCYPMGLDHIMRWKPRA